MEPWLAVADEIRRGHCHVQWLFLTMLQDTRSEATEAVKSSSQRDSAGSQSGTPSYTDAKGFMEEACVALVEALTVNTTLRLLLLSFNSVSGGLVQDPDAFSVPAYDAFSAMLRVNTSLFLKLPPFDEAVGDERLVASRNQMIIEQHLN